MFGLPLVLPRLPRLPGLAPVGHLPAGRIVELPGRGSTYVVDSGPVADAPTFMLLHGAAATGLMMWYPALEMMRGFGRVVVFDQRWHGQGISAPRFLLEDCADDVAALADAPAVDKFVPVGYSMGSLVAQLVWYRHRERLDGLVLGAAATGWWNGVTWERLGASVLATLILDHRVDPAITLGLKLGDAPVVRNAGGRVTPSVIEEIAYLAFLGRRMSGGQLSDDTSVEVAVIHHTQCGTGFLADPGFRREACEATGVDEKTLEASAVADPHTTVSLDVGRLLTSPLLPPTMRVSGHVYDLEIGRVTTVVDARQVCAR